MTERALVVLSGGQDSTTCLFLAISRYGAENVFAIGFDYGQRHKAELECARDICIQQGVHFEVIPTPIINELTSNALTRDIVVEAAEGEDSLPNTFVEGRNLLFFSYAAIYAKGHGLQHIMAGVSEADFSGYPDCRDVFVKSLNVTLNLAMDYGFVLETPLMWLNKAQVWQLADNLGALDVIKNQTLTCYNGIRGAGCTECPACVLRRNGYESFLKGGGKGLV